MNSSDFLNALGNENRRKILDLLSQKPCYLTEIGEELDLSPKAVIDHLNVLEDLGIVDSQENDRRRYFYIVGNFRLEVALSPYYFRVKGAYPRPARSKDVDYNYIDMEAEEPEEQEEKLEFLREVKKELSLAQRRIHSKILETRNEIENGESGKS